MKNIKQRIYSSLIASIIATTLTVSTEAACQSNITEGFYVSGYLGTAKVHNTTFSDDATAVTAYGLASKFGLAADAALGYRCEDIRAELALGLVGHHAQRESLTATIAGSEIGLDLGADGGNVSAATFMLNTYYDYNNSTGFIPYIGAGIGLVRLHHDLRFAGTPPSYRVDDGHSALVGQAIVGVGYDITPHLRAMAEYRFQIAAKGKLNLEDVSDQTNQVLRGRYQSRRFYAGLTYFM